MAGCYMLALVIRTVGLVYFSACAVPGAAQDAHGYPRKPVRLVTASAGSQTDAMARIIGAKLAQAWAQPVVVENRVGAGGVIGATIVAKATSDGHTLLFQSPQFAVGAALSDKLPYDPIKDFAGIAFIGNSTLVILAANAIGVKSVKELMAYAKAQAKPILFSSAGAGTSTHMNGERFKLASGISATHVGFKGAADAVVEVAAGRVHFTVSALSVSLPMIRSGQVTPLAVIAGQRSPTLPELPLMREVFPDYGREARLCCWRRRPWRSRCGKKSPRM
ncbi:MAG: tripartite tricarboxylate transporter substrate binding protein [Betaproteobacteria bacterium]|nr:tripartite tricarboxylate transporter substrate binding protein [Betaproteobacteria bacterium]